MGAPLILEDLKARNIEPDYCIVGEPTNMAMVVAHPGERHCGIPLPRAWQVCPLFADGAVHQLPSAMPVVWSAMSTSSALKKFIIVMIMMICLMCRTLPYQSARYRVETATNIVPNLCEFTFDYRNLPHMTQNDILTPIKAKVAELSVQMQTRAPETGIELLQEENVPAMTDNDSAELQAMIAALTNDDNRHKVAYATEGGQFTNAGIPTIICGPGSIEQAHKADEYVKLTEIEKCDQFLRKLLSSCATN